MAGSPERMLLAAILIGIGFRRDVLARGALTLFERVGIGIHKGAFPVQYRGLSTLNFVAVI